MAVLIRKAHDFIFDRGTIARSNTIDMPAIHGRAVQISANNLVRLRVRMGDPTRNLPRNEAPCS